MMRKINRFSRSLILLLFLSIFLFSQMPFGVCQKEFEVLPQESDYFYVFKIDNFKGKLYVFLSTTFPEDSKPALIKVFNAERNVFERFGTLDPDAREFQLRNTYNDNDDQFFLALRHAKSGQGGRIYRSRDMKSFKLVYDSKNFGIRAVIKFKGMYLAGTDEGGA